MQLRKVVDADATLACANQKALLLLCTRTSAPDAVRTTTIDSRVGSKSSGCSLLRVVRRQVIGLRQRVCTSAAEAAAALGARA